MSRASKTGVRGLYRDTDGRYRIDLRWTDPETGERRRHRERLPVRTNAESAKRRARQILDAALAGTFDPHREAPVTLHAALERYLEHCETHGIKSTRSRRTHAKGICAFFGGSSPLADLAAFDVERLKAQLRKKRAPATVNRYLGTLKTFVRWAAREGLMSHGLAAELRDVRLLREPAGRVRWLTDTEQQTLHEHLDGWLRPIVFTALGTGARRTELTGLRWRHVDREHLELVLEHTKNGRTRHVPISPAVLSVIDAQLPGAPDSFVFDVPKRSARKASPRRSEEERRGDVVTKAWARFCAVHGIVDLRVHDLRHDAATRMRRAGVGLDTVAAILGHSDLRVASRYAHLGREDLRAAVAAAAASLTPDGGVFAPSMPPGPGSKEANSAGL